MAIAGHRLAAAVKAVAEQDRQKLSRHPLPEQLIAYQERRLSPEDQVPLKDHLALCPSCAATVADLESFPQIEPRTVVSLQEHPEPPEQVERTLAALRQAGAITQTREQVQPAPISNATPPPPLPSSPWRTPRWRMPTALAASLVVALVGGAFWFGTQQSPTVIRVTTPAAIASAQIQVVAVSPLMEAVARGPQELPPTRVEPDADALLFVLAIAEDSAQPNARIEVLDADARPLWSTERAARRRDGTYTVQLPRALLPEGEIEFRFFPLEDSTEPFALYQIRLELPPES